MEIRERLRQQVAAIRMRNTDAAPVDAMQEAS
jgi:hypothetical protein